MHSAKKLEKTEARSLEAVDTILSIGGKQGSFLQIAFLSLQTKRFRRRLRMGVIAGICEETGYEVIVLELRRQNREGELSRNVRQC